MQCPGRDSNSHGPNRPPPPQSGVSTNFTTWAHLFERANIPIIFYSPKFLHKNHQYYLREHHSDEHRQRIDRRIGHRGTVAARDLVGIGQRHGVGHGTAQHAARRGEVDLAAAHGIPAYEQRRQQRDGEAERHPHGTTAAERGFEERRPGTKPKARQIERQAERPKHEIDALGRVGYDMQTVAESADKDSDDDRTAGQTEFHSEAHVDGAYDDTEHDAHEDGDKVRLVEALH